MKRGHNPAALWAGLQDVPFRTELHWCAKFVATLCVEVPILVLWQRYITSFVRPGDCRNSKAALRHQMLLSPLKKETLTRSSKALK